MSDKKYNQSDKGKARTRRYRQSAKGREYMARQNARRIYVGGMVFYV